MLNEYELAREARIARNNRVIAELDLVDKAAKFSASLRTSTRSQRTRAVRVRGCEPTRKSERRNRPVHSNLSEELLSGGPEPKTFTFTALRRRFQTETMPKRKAADHEFPERYKFTDSKTRSTANTWNALLARQPDLSEQPSICEHIAFNLGEQLVTFESFRGANEDRMKRFTKVAFTDMNLLVGPETAVEKVLEQLQQGARTGP